MIRRILQLVSPQVSGRVLSLVLASLVLALVPQHSLATDAKTDASADLNAGLKTDANAKVKQASRPASETKHTAQTIKPRPLEVLTITASRQAMAIKHNSTSISVVDEHQLQAIGHQHINQTLARVPGSWISRGNGQEHLSAIRSPVLTGAGACGAFFMAEDGISLRAAGFCNVNQLFDTNTEQASRIEVIRGPGSVLYGANAVHGTINIISPDMFVPRDEYLSQEIGPDNYWRSSVSTQSVKNNHALGVYANASHDGGYQEGSGYEQQKLNLVHQYMQDAFSVKSMLSTSHINQQTAGFIRGKFAYKDEALKRQNSNPEAFRHSQSWRAYSRLSWEMPGSEQDSELNITPYLRYNKMTFLQHYFPWQPEEDNSHRSMGIKSVYSQHQGEFSWHGGLDLEFTQGQLQETQKGAFSASIPQGAHYDYRVDSRSMSPFVDVDWFATQVLTVNLGVRYDHIVYDYDNRLSSGSACDLGVSNCRFYRPEDETRNFGHWSPRLGLVYQVNEQLNLYGELAQGFRAPHTSELYRLQAGQISADLDTEQLTSIQFGLRGYLDSFSYELSLYQMHKSHFIFQDSQSQYVGNGETQHLGFEFSLSYAFNDQWMLSLGGSVAEHEYANDLRLIDESIEGNQIDTAPKEMLNTRVSWTPSTNLQLELEWQHLGEYYLNPENSASYPGHDLLHLRGQVQISDKLALSLRLNNVLDKDYAERADFAFGSYRYFVGQPRSVFLTLRYQMD
ncbi:TonB-dependent receptor [Shewanella denitrificans OS217]|uniref:TonB-dependent receptor n=1 Tax=Shewanella denitrificans (strain OS217 / ATCC BAA-1090 / DSM 15013) TaxID=318161 RepID=Q12QT7_SHEDO|nr:TonB-dependent receptor [Shewanella denitrificans]ABE54189.1 TonB-dependent receptor [Shewanella denitrificans OS217]